MHFKFEKQKNINDAFSPIIFSSEISSKNERKIICEIKIKKNLSTMCSDHLTFIYEIESSNLS